jgi:hypothetical protein
MEMDGEPINSKVHLCMDNSVAIFAFRKSTLAWMSLANALTQALATLAPHRIGMSTIQRIPAGSA